MRLSAEQIARYQRDGFLVVEGCPMTLLRREP